MRGSLWSGEFGLGCALRSFVRFLDVSVSRAMGCFIDCFRVRDEDDDDGRLRRHRRRRAPFSRHREVIVSQNPLSVLLSPEGVYDSQWQDGGKLSLGSPQISEDLREEAKLLKACGTIVETPAELRKTSRKFKASPPDDIDSEPSKLNSWLLDTSIKKLQLDQYPDEPATPIQVSEEWQKGTVSSEHTSSSCISNVQNTGGLSISSVEGSGAGSSVSMKVKESDNVTSSGSPRLSATKDHCRNKSVRFECDLDMSSSRSVSENASQNSKNFDSPGNRSVSKNSPNPTPPKLSDDMQTPGTVFATNMEDIANGKKTRIRSQYVYSVLNPVEDVSQYKVLKGEDSNSSQLSSKLIESVENSENGTPKSEVGVKVEQTSARKGLLLDGSLSSCMKPVTSTQNANTENIGTVSSWNPHFGRTPGDRPIIGLVAAHWNEDGYSYISPKWWDGNGIPNSTNKYKEDQKVSWHATPFEERLEKALSQETALPPRNFIKGKPIVFDEKEEADTALSQFQSSTRHAKSVVSF